MPFFLFLIYCLFDLKFSCGLVLSIIDTLPWYCVLRLFIGLQCPYFLFSHFYAIFYCFWHLWHLRLHFSLFSHFCGIWFVSDCRFHILVILGFFSRRMVLVYKHVIALLVVPRFSHYALSVIVIARLSDSLLKLLCSSFFNYTFIFVSTLLLDFVGISGLVIYVLFLLWQFVYLLCRNVLHSLEHVSRYSTYSFISGTVTSLSSGSFLWILWSCIFVHWFHCVIIALDLFDRSTVLYLLLPVSYFTWNWHSLLCKSFYWSFMY